MPKARGKLAEKKEKKMDIVEEAVEKAKALDEKEPEPEPEKPVVPGQRSIDSASASSQLLFRVGCAFGMRQLLSAHEPANSAPSSRPARAGCASSLELLEQSVKTKETRFFSRAMRQTVRP